MQHFITLRLPAHQANARRRDIEERGQQANDGLVRFTVRRRGCRAYQQPAVTNVEDFVAACPRLHTYGYGKPIADPSHTGFRGRHPRTRYKSPMNSLTRAPSAISANIGEISNPPIGGIRRRKGRSSGSVSEYTIATAGL